MSSKLKKECIRTYFTINLNNVQLEILFIKLKFTNKVVKLL